ncbi:aminotransferase class V-fold PLP-dependent enzyme [Brumimicrobium mesophilum]|uniref:aminotransferase class V-fold PLP-dependent enzyme n=1 Tax=Brumimicrobium mesophilum TaxID=392717 RepID=UPI000D1444EA|nr:aminotransferase class V-fold PLP-dependent enzyme [Brumimicrobium mesophilum]
MFNRKNNQYKQFLKDYPQYNETKNLDKLRKKEYKRIDQKKHVYLDYTGGNLYAESQINKHLEILKQETFGNPHSTNPTSQLATKLCEESRSAILDFFNAKDEYFCVFTPNASGSLKIIGESYPFCKESFLLLSLDNHNSVSGIREFAKNKGSKFCYTPIQTEDLKLDEKELLKHLDSHSESKNKLFAFPAQSNVSGIKHPLEYIKLAQEKGWDVLLDAAAFAPSNRLDLKEIKPDFVSISFYKIFGYPTGLGCLLIKKDKFNKLIKPWYAGGTVTLASSTIDAHYLQPNHERFEEGTINYLDIPAIKIGLEHIKNIKIENISKRVKTLTHWMLENLSQLKHKNGKKLIHIFGSHDVNERGGTLVMNFYNQNGEIIPFQQVEKEANNRNISIRTGCFCNPGIDETNYAIPSSELEKYFSNHKIGNYTEMVNFTGKLRGSIRISVGLVSNYEDVATFKNFAETFLDK